MNARISSDVRRYVQRSSQEEGPHNERHLADPQHPHSTGGGQTRILGPIFLDLDPDKEQVHQFVLHVLTH
jgi:hypothetical protein